VITFIAGLVIGVAFGMIVVGFLAIGAYDRGYDAAQRAPWRLELRRRSASATRRVSTTAA
jgi:hypothetical protein